MVLAVVSLNNFYRYISIESIFVLQSYGIFYPSNVHPISWNAVGKTERDLLEYGKLNLNRFVGMWRIKEKERFVRGPAEQRGGDGAHHSPQPERS